jgi:hypothetical protein
MPENEKAIALEMIAKHSSFLGNVDREALGKHLAQQVLSYLLVVYQVFDELKSYDDKSWTGFYLIKSLEDVGLYKLAKYKEGNALLNIIDRWLFANPDSLRGGNIDNFRIIRQRIFAAKRQAGNIVNYNTTGFRQLYDYEIPPNGNKEICWELPEEGTGYKVYKRNDEPIDGLDQIGTEHTVKSIVYLAKIWTGQNQGVWLEIGDISRAGGLDTSAHKTHEDGKAFDMRPLRNDGGYGTPFALDANTCEHPLYHRDHTANFIRLVNKLYPGSIIYFNDKHLYNLPEFSSYLKFNNDHFNHLHVIFPGGARDKDKNGIQI